MLEYTLKMQALQDLKTALARKEDCVAVFQLVESAPEYFDVSRLPYHDTKEIINTDNYEIRYFYPMYQIANLDCSSFQTIINSIGNHLFKNALLDNSNIIAIYPGSPLFSAGSAGIFLYCDISKKENHAEFHLMDGFKMPLDKPLDHFLQFNFPLPLRGDTIFNAYHVDDEEDFYGFAKIVRNRAKKNNKKFFMCNYDDRNYDANTPPQMKSWFVVEETAEAVTIYSLSEIWANINDTRDLIHKAVMQ